MKRTVIIAVLGFCAIFLSSSAIQAGDDCTFAALKSNVDKAAEIITAKGKDGLKEVAGIRFCNDSGYIYVQDLGGEMLMHPILPHLVGRNVASMKDAKGKQFALQALKDVKEKGEAYFTMTWPKPGAKEASIKCSYAKRVMLDGKPVMVASGLYDIPEGDCGK
jgi:methyl-accepting chemotaxis protein